MKTDEMEALYNNPVILDTYEADVIFFEEVVNQNVTIYFCQTLF